ncbi:MAG: transcription termination factor Rho [Solirubrobacteraceae bacterium]|jgi:transcription termination factor Rho|nr:transcription termination factor Rho [Solirubrobacteraceae bacterium]
MPVLDRTALEASPLADLHAVASELSIDGYRRLRRAELITTILKKQGGVDAGEESGDDGAERGPRRARSRRPAKATAEAEADTEAEAPDEADGAEHAAKGDDDEDGGPSARRRRGRRGGRGSAQSDDRAPGRSDDRASGRSEDRASGRSHDRASGRTDEGGSEREAGRPSRGEEPDGEESVVEGVVELLAGGSGFVRVSPPESSDDDVYVSSAQVKRCELVSGDRVSGPKRAPRRSERFASLIRIETINGRPASELADSVRFDDLPAAFPSEQLKLESDDPTLKAIDGLAPFGKGSRVSIVGGPRSGKTELVKRLAAALGGQDGLAIHVVLAGARPEEISEWTSGESDTAPAATSSLTASEETINASIEAVVDQGRRLAVRGADAVVLIDSLDGASRSVARRALGAARKIVDSGSLTVVATASAPLGGETTVVALDATRTAAAKFPALDILSSGVLRPELLVGDRGAKAIARAHADAVKPEKK